MKSSDYVFTDEELAFLEAIGEAPPTEKNAAKRREFQEQRARIDSVFAMPLESSEIPDDMLNKLIESGRKQWEEHFGQPFVIEDKTAESTELKREVRTPLIAPARRSNTFRTVLALAACITLAAVVGSLLFTPSATQGTTFAWTNDPDPAQQYDLWVLPFDGPHQEVTPLYTRKGVRSPVSVEDVQLEKDKPYRLLVCVANAGKFAGEPVPFKPASKVVVSGPGVADMLKKLIAAGKLDEAQRLLDALPPSVRERTEIRELAIEVALDR